MLKKLMLLIRVSRPLRSWPVVAIFAAGFAISGSPFTLIAAADALLTMLLLPMVVFGVNDIYDYESDLINKRKNSERSGYGTVLEKRNHGFVRKSAIGCSLVLLAFALFTRNLTNIGATGTALVIGWAYSAPPFRLKERPLLDSLSNSALILSVAIIGFSFGSSLSSVPFKAYLASLGVAAIHAIAAIMDYSPDKKAGVKTIATFFGKRGAAVLALAMMLSITLFAGIASVPLRVIVWYTLLSSLLLAITGSEVLAKRLFKLGYLPGLAALILFIYGLSHKVL